MTKLWVWTAPKRIEREAGLIRFEGWREYEPARVPALWLRVAELGADPDGWAHAVERYGPLLDTFGEEPRAERYERDPWVRAIGHLWTVSSLWKEADGIWELPPAPPVELTGAYRRLQNELTRVIADDGVKLALHGLDPVPEPATLESFLWFAAAAAVRERARHKRCERCDGWFPIRRSDAQYCSATCRNWRPAPASDAIAESAE